MKVSWSKRAIKSLTLTSVYILQEFGDKANKRFLQEIQRVSDLLEENPFMGQVEHLLIGKSKEYRSVVVNRQNKIVYYSMEIPLEFLLCGTRAGSLSRLPKK